MVYETNIRKFKTLSISLFNQPAHQEFPDFLQPVILAINYAISI